MFHKRPRESESGEPPPNEESAKALARREETAPPVAAQTPAREAVLEFTSGPDKGKSIRLERIVTLIGRGETCDVVLADETVSREHGQVEQSLNQWVYTNFSENGTWINRQKAERVVLASGDIIEAGRQTRIRFVLRDMQHTEVAQVVRRRPRRTREEIEAQMQQEDEQEAPPPTLGETLKKRRRLLIGLGIYLGVIALAVLVFAMVGTGKKDPDTIAGRTGLYDRAELERWLNNLKYGLPRDDALYIARITLADRLYSQYPFDQKMDLFQAIKAYQEANEYGGGRLRADYARYKQFEDAKKKLVDELWGYYRDGVVAQDDQKDLRKAVRFYNEIKSRLPAEAPFYQHVENRIKSSR